MFRIPLNSSLEVKLGGSNTTVLGKLAQSVEQWQSPMTTLMLSLLQWEVGQVQRSYLHADDTFTFSYRDCKWRCRCDYNITHIVHLVSCQKVDNRAFVVTSMQFSAQS